MNDNVPVCWCWCLVRVKGTKFNMVDEMFRETSAVKDNGVVLENADLP